MRQENNKGIVSAYRVPKAEWWIVKNAYSPIVVKAHTVTPEGGRCRVSITNHYAFTDLSEISCRWTALIGDHALQSGTRHISCAPMQSTDAGFPAPDGMDALRLQFLHADGTEIVAVRLAVAGAPQPSAPAARVSGAALTTTNAPDRLTVANALQSVVFDKHTGMLLKWSVDGRDLIVAPPLLNLGESKTARSDGFYRASQPPITQGAEVTTANLANGVTRVRVVAQVLSRADGDKLGSLTTVYDIASNAEISVAWTLDWTAAKTQLWEAGLRIPVALGLSQMRWYRAS